MTTTSPAEKSPNRLGALPHIAAGVHVLAWLLVIWGVLQIVVGLSTGNFGAATTGGICLAGGIATILSVGVLHVLFIILKVLQEIEGHFRAK